MYYDHDSMYGGHNKVQNKTKQKHEYSIITPKSIHVYIHTYFIRPKWAFQNKEIINTIYT